MAQPVHFFSISIPQEATRRHQDICTLGGNGRLFLELERFRLQSFTFVLFVKPYTTDVISKQLSPRHTQFKA